ncbi:hypothetical protein ASF61_08670 [Duganella sp. Leaf126]|nr:hypothetical protein ASF61_08670 [Duganella sp. Leaf126]
MVVTTDAMAANTASGASFMMVPVMRNMTCASWSMAAVSLVADSPSAPSALPKNSENTSTCRISLLAIASTGERGTRWLTKSLSVNAAVFRPVAASAGGSGRPRCVPSCSRFDSSMPSVSDSSEATTNQAMALTPIRLAALPSPRWAMPTVSVENTSSAITILIRRRKTSVMMAMCDAIWALSCRSVHTIWQP